MKINPLCADQDLHATKPFKKEIIRKVLHLPVFLFPLLAIYSKAALIGLLCLLIVCYLGILFLDHFSSIRIEFISSIIKYCQRAEDYDYAPVLLALGMLVATLISNPISLFFSAYVLAISDSASAITGMFYGKHKIGNLKKSYEGSAAFFVTCFFGGLIYLSPVKALIAALCLTVVEIVSIRGTDNFSLPVLAQVLLGWLG